jgi:HAE1 family hydrophobic/amphiphilic exporter-1
MTLSEYSVRRRVTVVMLTWGAILLGVIGFTRLPQELFPPISFPQITVVTEYPNAAPEEIETLVTRPLEEAVGAVVGLKRIESVSQEGRSNIIVSFDWGQDIDFAALAVREKIDLVKEKLPKECGDPVVLKFDPLARPILILSVSGQMPPTQLKAQVERILKDNLEKVEGVASVALSGGVDREILVEVDQPRLSASNLSILELVDSLEKANVSYPAGGIKKGLYEYLIRTVGEFQSLRDIAFAVVGTETVAEIRSEERPEFVERGATGPRKTVDVLREELGRGIERQRLVLTKDVGEVKDTFAERTSISRYKGKENISLSIQKQAGANTIQVVDRIKRTMGLLREELEVRRINASVIYDHSLFIRKSLRGLLDEGLQGGALAFAVLYFFLRSISTALIVTSAIPITVISIFFLMQLQGLTINIMSLGGLALGIGMMVDQGIVVMENIYRMRQGGTEAEDAAIKGTNEVFWPIFSSTLTSIAVFFPLILFVPGVAGQLFKDLSWTVIYAQVISLLVSVTVITMLSTKVKPSSMEYKPIHWLKGLEEHLIRLGAPEKQNRVLRTIVLAAAGTALAGAFLMNFLDKEVLPKVDQGQFLVKVDLPIGTRLEVTDEIVTVVEGVLLKMKEIESAAVTIGSARGKKEEVKVETLRSSQGLILVNLKKGRRRSSAAVVEDLRRELKGYNLRGARVEVALQESEFQFVGGVKPIQIEVKGYEYEMSLPIVQRIKQRLADIRGVVEIHDDMGEATPETKLEIDKKRAALYGISALDISLTAKAAIDGVVATTFREKGREYDIRVQLSEKDRQRIENLGELLLYSEVLDTMLPLKEVADMKQGLGPSEIRRKDQQRSITVSADIQKGYKQARVLEQVQAMLRSLEIPEDYQVVLSGQAREVRESFRKVYFALALSIILIYMIMASQFESLMQPLLIMITVPLSIIGISLALFVTGTSLNVISLLGMVMLGGVVVNNGIVLMEYINQRRAEGVPLVEAAFESAKVRTRPILMSALTSSIGLVPIALGLGEGSELRAPLAITTIGGLLSSTVLTLVVLPCFYVLATRMMDKFLGIQVVEETTRPEGETYGPP